MTHSRSLPLRPVGRGGPDPQPVEVAWYHCPSINGGWQKLNARPDDFAGVTHFVFAQ